MSTIGSKPTKKRTKKCVCQDAGGFAEHLSDWAWSQMMKRNRGCPVHGDGSWQDDPDD